MTQDHLSVEEYRQTVKRGRARITSRTKVVDGIAFQSEHEANRYQELRLELRAGRISDLRLQVPFSLAVNRVHVCVYKADFCYFRDGVEVVEDAKAQAKTARGKRATRTEVYRIKRALMRACHNIEIQEV